MPAGREGRPGHGSHVVGPSAHKHPCLFRVIALKPGTCSWEEVRLSLFSRLREVVRADLPEPCRAPAGQEWAEMPHGGQLSSGSWGLGQHMARGCRGPRLLPPIVRPPLSPGLSARAVSIGENYGQPLWPLPGMTVGSGEDGLASQGVPADGARSKHEEHGPETKRANTILWKRLEAKQVRPEERTADDSSGPRELPAPARSPLGAGPSFAE